MLQRLARVFGPSGWQTEAALLQRYDVTVLAAAFANGDEVVGLGIMLEAGDTIVDIFADLSPEWDGSYFIFGKSPIAVASGPDSLSSYPIPYDLNVYDGGPYGGHSANGPCSLASSSGYNGAGRGSCIPVLAAHELSVRQADSGQNPVTSGSVTFSVFVLPAAALITLPTIGGSS